MARWALAILAITVACAPQLRAQAVTGTIFGTVWDEAGLVIPGVTLTAVHTETGAERSVIGDEEGRYRLAGLVLGNYQVRAELPGFKREVRSGIQVTLGSESTVDFKLVVGEISEEVLVTGETPLVETTSGTLGGLVNEERIKDLPLNGRSFQQLALLEPGVVMSTKITGSFNAQGTGTRISAGGAKTSFNVFLLDGIELNDAKDNSGNNAGGNLLGVEGIREFRVLTSNFSAEYGRSAGALVSAVTKSGTNTFHGGVYEFHRNSALDARNFFDRLKPSFKRNQFGFEADGPIRRNSTFFMVNYEGLREGRGQTFTTFVPDENARRGILPGRQPFRVSPAIVPYLNLFPLPNGPLLDNGTGRYVFAATNTINQDFRLAKVDHRFSDSDSISVRYRFEKGELVRTSGFVFDDFFTSRSQNAVIDYLKIISPNLLNTARLSYNRPLSQQGGAPRVPMDSSLLCVPGSGTHCQISVTGLSGYGGQQELIQYFHHLYQVSDDMLYTRGSHSFKWGALLRFVQYKEDNRIRIGGRWSFPSVFDFLTNNPNDLQTLHPPVDAIRHVRQNLFGLYLQDDFQATRGLTVNLGLRWEFTTVPYELDNKMTNLRRMTDATLSVGRPLFENPSGRNFAPRLGLAWDPFGDAKTVLRGGFGLFHNQLTNRYWSQVFAKAEGFANLVRIANPPFPITSLSQLNVPVVSQVFAFQFDGVKTPYMMQWNLTAEREFLPETVFMAGYVGSRGVHLPVKSDVNIPVPEIRPDGRQFFASGLPRRNRNYGNVSLIETAGNSFYHSFRFSVRRRLAEGFQFQASYTFSRTIDEGKGEMEMSYSGSPNRPQDPFNKLGDRGLSEVDVRNNFVLNWSYALPFGRDLTGAAGQLAKGWQINSIVTMAAGAPFWVGLNFDQARTLDFDGLRPNLRPGASNNPILGTPDKYFDLSAFQVQEPGFYGTLGRNTLIGPGLANVDFSLSKNFDLTEKVDVQFRAEFFNVLNRANFDAPAGGATAFNRFGVSQAQAATLTQTTTTSRQIQFGLKILF